MNWQQIKLMAGQFVHRSDIDWDALQPLALDDINQTLSVQENESVVSLALVAAALANAYSSALPAGYARARAAFDASGVEMTLTDINGLVGRPGSAKYCAVSGGKLFAYVTAATLIYSVRAPLLVGDADHNWLSDNYSPVLLYGLLYHAAHRVQDFEARDQHKGAFDYAAGMANANYSMATLAAGAESRSPYLAVSN